MKRSLCLAVAACLLATAPGAPAMRKLTCRSGTGLYEQAGVRMFEVLAADDVPVWYGCSRLVRRPRRIATLSPSVTNELTVFGRTGDRLAFAIEEFADGGGGWEVGWFDTRTGAAATAVTDSLSKQDFTAPVAGAAVGADGGVAYVLWRESEDDEPAREIAYRPFAGGRLGNERALLTAPAGEVDAATLAVAGGAVTLRTEGVLHSLAVTAPAAPAPAPARSRVSCRAGQTVYEHGARVFVIRRGPRRGLYACTLRRRSVTARIARTLPAAAHFTETGRRLAFAIAPSPGSPGGALVSFNTFTGALRIDQLAAGPYGKPPRVLAVAPGVRGGIAAVIEDADGRAIVHTPAVQRVLARLRPEEIEPATLRVSGANVSWRAVGAPRSVPLG